MARSNLWKPHDAEAMTVDNYERQAEHFADAYAASPSTDEDAVRDHFRAGYMCGLELVKQIDDTLRAMCYTMELLYLKEKARADKAEGAKNG